MVAIDNDALGICAQIVATFLAACAYALQKKAHLDLAASGDTRSVYLTRLWQVGFLLMVVMSGIDVWSFSLLDQTKLAAFGAVTLAWNCIIAALVLKEHFSRIDAIAVAVIAAGTVLSLLSAGESSEFTMPEILDRLHDSYVYAYVPVSLVFILGAGIFIELTTRANPESWSVATSRALTVLAPLTGGLCMSYTGYTTKTVSTVVFGGEWSEFTHGPIWAYGVVLAIACFFQVRFLNKGLEFFDAMIVVPIFQACIILSNSVAGIVFFGDLRDESVTKKVLFFVGSVVSMGGVCILTLKTKGVSEAVIVARDRGHSAHEIHNLDKPGTGIAFATATAEGDTVGLNPLAPSSIDASAVSASECEIQLTVPFASKASPKPFYS